MRGRVEKVEDFFVLGGRLLADEDRADLILPGNYPAPETFLAGRFVIKDGVARFVSDENAVYNVAGREFERRGPADEGRPPWRPGKFFGRI